MIKKKKEFKPNPVTAAQARECVKLSLERELQPIYDAIIDAAYNGSIKQVLLDEGFHCTLSENNTIVTWTK